MTTVSEDGKPEGGGGATDVARVIEDDAGAVVAMTTAASHVQIVVHRGGNEYICEYIFIA